MIGACVDCGEVSRYTPAMVCRCGVCGSCIGEADESISRIEALELINNHDFFDPISDPGPSLYTSFAVAQNKKMKEKEIENIRVYEEHQYNRRIRILRSAGPRSYLHTDRQLIEYEKEEKLRQKARSEIIVIRESYDDPTRNWVYKWTKSDGTTKIVFSSKPIDTEDAFGPYQNMKLITSPNNLTYQMDN